jgi:hypothetical protein
VDKVIAKLGDFGGIDPKGIARGLLFPASLAFSQDGKWLHELDPEPALCGHAGGNPLGLNAASSGLHRIRASVQDPAVSG